MNKSIFTLACALMIAGILTCMFLIGSMLVNRRAPHAEALRGARFVQGECFHAAA